MERIRRVSDLGIHFFSSYYAVLTGSPVPTMHRWSQFGGQRCASNVHGRGWTSGREECLTRHACRRFAPACSDKENRRFAPVLPGWDEPGAARAYRGEAKRRRASIQAQIGGEEAMFEAHARKVELAHKVKEPLLPLC